MSAPLRCRLGWHDYVDFPDPNPETGGLEKQGYRACTRCSREKDARIYLSRSGRWRMPDARHSTERDGRPLRRRRPTER